MTKTIALVTVHGMGETEQNYADSLIGQLERKLGTAMQALAIRPAYYQHILQPNEMELWNRTQRLATSHYTKLRQFLLFGFADAAGLENRKEAPGSTYEEAQLELARTLLQARADLGGNGPLVVIAQSLGCQVFSSYLYDAQKAEGGGQSIGIWRNIGEFAARITGAERPLTDEELSFLRGDTISALVTTGCNIPVFVAAHQRMMIKPIAPPNPQFRWINFYDPHDVLGWPLQPLSEGYETLVEDRPINAGRGLLKWLGSATPMSHMNYWDDASVVEPLIELLGLRG